MQSEQLRQWNPAIKESHQDCHQSLLCVSSLCDAKCTKKSTRLACAGITGIILRPFWGGCSVSHWGSDPPPSEPSRGCLSKREPLGPKVPTLQTAPEKHCSSGIPVIWWKTYFLCLTRMQQSILYKANRMNCNNWNQRELPLLIWGKGSWNSTSCHLKQWQRIYQQFI